MNSFYTTVMAGLLACGHCHCQDSLEISSTTIRTQLVSDMQTLNTKLVEADLRMDSLQRELSEETGMAKRLKILEDYQKTSDERLKILERKPRIKIAYGGYLAFNELLLMNEKIKLLDALGSSRSFYGRFGHLGSITSYTAFSEWKSRYEEWYKKQSKKDEVMKLVNASITLVGDVSKDIPAYGSTINTIAAGVTTIIAAMDKKDRPMIEASNRMLSLLMVINQFENDVEIVNREWELIDRELAAIISERAEILQLQKTFYEFQDEDCSHYSKASDIDHCRNRLRDNLLVQVSDTGRSGSTLESWLGEVEMNMHRVQFLRIRLGELMARIQVNFDKYGEIIDYYSGNGFPEEFRTSVASLSGAYQQMKKTITALNAEEYIFDSKTLFMERSGLHPDFVLRVGQ